MYKPKQIVSLYNELYDDGNIFNIIDIIGIDVVYEILQNLKEDDDSLYLPLFLRDAISRNLLGKKTRLLFALLQNLT